LAREGKFYSENPLENDEDMTKISKEFSTWSFRNPDNFRNRENPFTDE
jgi:hypothetical protein